LFLTRYESSLPEGGNASYRQLLKFLEECLIISFEIKAGFTLHA